MALVRKPRVQFHKMADTHLKSPKNYLVRLAKDVQRTRGIALRISSDQRTLSSNLCLVTSGGDIPTANRTPPLLPLRLKHQLARPLTYVPGLVLQQLWHGSEHDQTFTASRSLLCQYHPWTLQVPFRDSTEKQPILHTHD